MKTNHYFLIGLMPLLLLTSSCLFASNNNSKQQVDELYSKYMEKVIGSLKCKAGEDSCYQKAFQQASEEVTGSFECVAKCITGGSYITGIGFGVSAILKHEGIQQSPTQLCQSEKYQQICQDAATEFCVLLCKKFKGS